MSLKERRKYYQFSRFYSAKGTENKLNQYVYQPTGCGKVASTELNRKRYKLFIKENAAIHVYRVPNLLRYPDII